MSVESLVTLLRCHQFQFASELELQDGIAQVLAGAPAFEGTSREHRLGKDRVDFFWSGVAIEVKVGGSLSAVVRQLYRYARSPDVCSIVLVTSRVMHARMPDHMCDKPVRVVVLRTGAF